MNKIREITISGYAGDPDYVGDDTAAEPADAEFLDLTAGHTDVEWFMDYVDGSGARVGSAGTFDAYAVWKTQNNSVTVYSREVTATSVAAGIRQRVYASSGAGAGKSLRSSSKLTIRIDGAISNPPAGAVTARIFAQEV